MHGFLSVEDVKERITNGVVDLFLKMREKKKTRYIGFTGHSSQEAHCYFLDFCKEKGYQMDSCLMPVNLVDPHYDSFLIHVLPKLLEQKVSLLAMKSMVFGKIFARGKELAPGVITPKNLHEYVYSLPVSCMLSGCETVAQVDENTAILENRQPVDDERRKDLLAAVNRVSEQGQVPHFNMIWVSKAFIGPAWWVVSQLWTPWVSMRRPVGGRLSVGR